MIDFSFSTLNMSTHCLWPSWFLMRSQLLFFFFENFLHDKTFSSYFSFYKILFVPVFWRFECDVFKHVALLVSFPSSWSNLWDEQIKVLHQVFLVFGHCFFKHYFFPFSPFHLGLPLCMCSYPWWYP